MGVEICTNIFDIAGDLRLERIQRIELRLVAQLVQEIHVDMGAVDVAVEIQQMDFQHGLQAFLDRGAHADVGRARDRLRGDARDRHGEHAGQRQALAPDLDVGGGKADGAAELLAVHDAPGNDEGAAQQSLGTLDVAARKSSAHGRAGNAEPAEIHRVHGLDHETVLASGLLQHREVSGAALAEAEIIADDQMPHRQPAHQNVLDELAGGMRRELAVEAADMDPVDAAFGEQFELVAQAGQARRRLLRREEFARMRFEGEHRRRQGQFARLGRQFSEQRAMTKMHAIEIADGQHRRRRRPLGNTAKNQHGS